MGKVRASDLKHPLRATLRDQREQAKKTATASRFALSGLSVTDEGVTTVEGDFVVEGDFTAESKVHLSALVDFNIPQIVNLHVINFAITASFAEKAGVDLTVPDECTRLQATTSVWMQGYNQNTTGGNNGAGGDYLYAYAKIGSTAGEYNATGVSGSGGAATASGGLSQLLTGLTPGDTVRIGGWGASQYTTIIADVTNKYTLTATLSWLR